MGKWKKMTLDIKADLPTLLNMIAEHDVDAPYPTDRTNAREVLLQQERERQGGTPPPNIR